MTAHQPGQARACAPRPLAGVTVVELRGRAPVDFAGLVLSDLGARVLCVEPPPRHGGNGIAQNGFVVGGRERIAINIKDPAGLDVLHRLVAITDVVLEGFRPGTAERLHVGPVDLTAHRPGLIYARISGYGQTGPFAGRAGHDLNYLAMSGLLGSFGRDPAGPPAPPLNLIGDFAGGALGCVVGILAAIIRRDRTREGAVIDAAMTEGASYLSSFVHQLRQEGSARSPIPWSDARGSNVLNGLAPFYDVYRTLDGHEVSFAAIEPEFFEQMILGLGLDRGWIERQNDVSSMDELRSAISDVVAARTLEELDHQLGTDACFAPVVTYDSAADHPQHVARGAFRATGAGRVPAPSPVFDSQPSNEPLVVTDVGTATADVLRGLGFDHDEISTLRADGAIWCAEDREVER